jgi:hypothetical protein
VCPLDLLHRRHVVAAVQAWMTRGVVADGDALELQLLELTRAQLCDLYRPDVCPHRRERGPTPIVGEGLESPHQLAGLFDVDATDSAAPVEHGHRFVPPERAIRADQVADHVQHRRYTGVRKHGKRILEHGTVAVVEGDEHRSAGERALGMEGIVDLGERDRPVVASQVVDLSCKGVDIRDAVICQDAQSSGRHRGVCARKRRSAEERFHHCPVWLPRSVFSRTEADRASGTARFLMAHMDRHTDTS